jgi:serine/threonine protein phosphatase PrpC
MTADFIAAGAFVTYGATQVGPSHNQHGLPREDAYSLGATQASEWVLLAVSDGLGSTRNAHAASRIATRRAVEEIGRLFNAEDAYATNAADWHALSTELMLRVADSLSDLIVDEVAAEVGHRAGVANSHRKSSTSPGCTLSVAALGPPIKGRYPLFWAAIGDSDVLLLDRVNGSIDFLTENKHKTGSLISNRTDSLPADTDRVQCGYQLADITQTALLATDGCAEAIREVPAQYARILTAHSETMPPPRVFAELVDFKLPGLNDDRTLVAAWPRNAARSGESVDG